MTTGTAFVDEWLKGKSREDFNIIEHLGGRILWPVKIQRFKADKKFHEEPAYLHVLDTVDLLQATLDAEAEFVRRGFDPKEERHAGLLAEVEAFAQVAIALREHKPHADGNHAPKHQLGILMSTQATGISKLQVLSLHGQLRVFEKFEDPRLESLSTDQVIAANMAMAEVGNVSPLVAIAGSEQDAFAISTAVILRKYLLHEHSSPSSTNSTTGRSRKKS